MVDDSKWEVFLEHYTQPNECMYNRVACAHSVEVTLPTVAKWFRSDKFLDKMQRALQKVMLNKSKLKDTLIESTIAIATASIADCFAIDPITGEQYAIPLPDLPPKIRMAVHKYKIIRVRIPDEEGRMEYRDVLDIQLIDKVNALRLLGEWVDIKNDEKKRFESKKDQILGLTIITGENKTKEISHVIEEAVEHGSDGNDSVGEIQLHDKADSRIEEVWIG